MSTGQNGLVIQRGARIRAGSPLTLAGVWHGMLVFFGLTNASGRAYAFWSGIGSDIGELTIIGGLVAIYRKHNCHARGCWRVGRLAVAGTPYVVCHRHHPDHDGARKATAETIARAHAEATKAT